MDYLKIWWWIKMKQNKGKKESKVKKYINNDGLFVQAVLTALVFVFFLLSFFYPICFLLTEVLLACDLLVMAYNNSTSYARNHMTLLYSIVGIVILVVAVYDIIQVI